VESDRSSEMRQITTTKLFSHPRYPSGVWVVDVDDHSRIAVDVSDARHSHEKTPDRIKSAAIAYSASHPMGVLETVVVVNLLGKKISSPRRE
jgi:hypothetical protein